uniref:Uncharacterized protein n=1 Tax=Phenylobacterium glaciei TaxID=2803784 RepID=A0A974P6U3_9CAUL|nr:hypothetical protein JKL49_13535 [Phenylobacterium glaciei]
MGPWGSPCCPLAAAPDLRRPGLAGGLNAPAEHPEFVSLSLDAKGKGGLVAKAEREGKPLAWFRYDTTDAGATWTEARPITGPEGTDLTAPDQTKVPAVLAHEIAAS